MWTWFKRWIGRTDTDGNRIELWLRKRARNALSRSAQRTLHSVATDLCRLRAYASPEEEEDINRLLDEVIYPAILEVKTLEC